MPQRSETGTSGLVDSNLRGEIDNFPDQTPRSPAAPSFNTTGKTYNVPDFDGHVTQPAQSGEADYVPENEMSTHGSDWDPNLMASADGTPASWPEAQNVSSFEQADDDEKWNSSQDFQGLKTPPESTSPESPKSNPGQGAPTSADQINAQRDVEDTSTASAQNLFVANNRGPGPVNQAVNQRINNYWKSDFVRQITVPDVDLRACSDELYVPPRRAEQLEDAARYLARHGVVVLNASPGSGRRTTALRLLSTLPSDRQPQALFDLEPEWSKPRVEWLPQALGQGYVLDLSEFPEGEPDDRFGRDLANYGADGKQNGWHLVVLASPQYWKGFWSEPTSDFTVNLSPPDAKQLVQRELQARSLFDRVKLLEQATFEQIWHSNPSAQEARRLARIIAESDPQHLQKILDEFKGWHTHIETLLNKGSKGEGDPSLLSTRATVWAGALLDGGQFQSVLKAADALLEALEISRKPAAVLADATSSRRLQAAGLVVHNDQAFHQKDMHDLAYAILQNLWEEFPTQRDLLRSWAVSVAADPSIPDEDAALITRMLLRLSTARRDGDVLDNLGAGLVGRRRPLAVEALTDAALDTQIGAHVRRRLYLWAKQDKVETLKLVAEICGGRLGEKLPDIALTRLRWVAGRSPLGARSVTDAFSNLVKTRPDEVRKATDAWFDDDKPERDNKLERQAQAVFLALASSDAGISFLLQGVEDVGRRRRFVKGWQRLLATERSREVVDLQLTKWGEYVEQMRLPRALLIDLLADVYEPEIYRSGLNRFFSDDSGFFQSFWGQVLEEAIVRNRHRREGQ